ncbi:MAG TPA: alpha/beta fold hydrolase [Burkholderiaceae bacterium]|jgi:predicted dienelactone hydrolase|nr:alpha/beta fold hydrolase [Burkholderiaceae bacterium]
MRATGVRSRRGGARAALAAALWSAAVSAHAAAALLQPQADGPLTTRTIEFADLVDRARGDRRVPIKVHLPSWTGPFPVVVLSHGAGGNWDSNHAQARHLASHGYVVLALEHVASNTERMRKGMRFGANMRAMTRDASEVLGRPRDVGFALDQAARWNQQHAELAGTLDLSRVAVMGHSFGAYTALALCGARPALDWLVPPVEPRAGLGPDLRDARVKACVALSPQGPGEPFFRDDSFASVDRAVLGISGSRDEQQGASPANRRRFFELVPPGRKVFVWLANADHLSFSDSAGSKRSSLPSRSRADVQPIARAATLLFLEAQLRGDAEADARLSERGLQPLARGVVDRVEVLRK